MAHSPIFLSFSIFSPIYWTKCIQYPNIKCDVLLPVYPIIWYEMYSHISNAYTHIHNHNTYTIHKTHSNHLHPKFEVTIEYPRWIITIITKKWFDFSANPILHVRFFWVYWSSTKWYRAIQFALVPVNIRSFQMLSHKWIFLLEAWTHSKLHVVCFYVV